MWGFAQLALAWGQNGRSLAVAVLVTLAFATLARTLRGVSISGALAGAVVCFLLYASAGPGAFVALAGVFVLTWIATKLGYRRKQHLGTAERREGRKASQVLANLSVAAVCAILFSLTHGNRVFLLALAAALGEATADTVSSELGQALSPRARLITTWREVPAGTDGGISLAGTLAGAAAAVLIAAVCAVVGLLPWNWAASAVVVLSAITGMIADSFLGAWLERRGVLNNDLVNLLGTLTAAGVALLLR
jgi:uncharacterized protein (TIGR00297 family)